MSQGVAECCANFSIIRILEVTAAGSVPNAGAVPCQSMRQVCCGSAGRGSDLRGCWSSGLQRTFNRAGPQSENLRGSNVRGSYGPSLRAPVGFW